MRGAMDAGRDEQIWYRSAGREFSKLRAGPMAPELIVTVDDIKSTAAHH